MNTDDPKNINAQANDIADRAAQGQDVTAEARKLLNSLRWKEDMVITNHEGERVWLTPCFDKDGKRTGIWDCCPEADPCDYHRALADAARIEVNQ